MLNNPIVSIIVPVFNAQAYIEECINSIICQSYTELEIIIIDDGSTDDSLQICKRIAKGDNRIVVVSQPNRGVVCARKQGIRKATGKYIMFVDSDDYVYPEYVQSMMEIDSKIELVTSGIVLGSKEIYDGISKGEYNVEISSPVIRNLIYAADNMSRGILSCIYAKRFCTALAKIICEDLDETIYYGEDGEFVYKYIIKCNKVCITNECNYNYRINDFSITHKEHKDFLINTNRLYISLKKEFENSPFCSELIPQLEKWTCEHIRMSPMKMGFGFKNLPVTYIITSCKEILDKSIVVYGAGKVGKDYIRQIKKGHLCKDFVWVDHNYATKEVYMGEQVVSPDRIFDYDFDYILIAINNEKIIKQIKEELMEIGICDEKIIAQKPLYIEEFYA